MFAKEIIVPTKKFCPFVVFFPTPPEPGSVRGVASGDGSVPHPRASRGERKSLGEGSEGRRGGRAFVRRTIREGAATADTQG